MRPQSSLAFVATLTFVFTVATVAEFVIGASHWSDHGSTNIGLGILGGPPTVFLIWVLVTLIRRSRDQSRREANSTDAPTSASQSAFVPSQRLRLGVWMLGAAGFALNGILNLIALLTMPGRTAAHIVWVGLGAMSVVALVVLIREWRRQGTEGG